MGDYINLDKQLEKKGSSNELNCPLMEELAIIQSSYPDVTALSSTEAEQKQAVYGKNTLAVSKSLQWYMILLYAIFQPFNLILVLLAAVSAATGDYTTTGIMVVMITLSSTLKFVQEFKSVVALEALKNMVENFATVVRLYEPPTYRDPNFEDVRLMDAGYATEQKLFLEDIVPGDLIKIRAGDLIPGDVKILLSKGLFVSEASLTGESIPVEKCQIRGDGFKVTVGNDPSICYMGSSVVSGTATAVVLKIGADTNFGKLAAELAKSTPPNAFQRSIRQVSYLFFGLMVVMLPAVTVLSGIIQKDWSQALLFAIGVAVGLTPEMLPMIGILV